MLQPLPTKTLGRTGLEVTNLGYGAMEVRGAPRARHTTEKQSEVILNAVLDAGINFVDTSNDYGLSEERIGKYISHRRSEFHLATKCGCPPGADPGGHIWTRENLFRGLHESLERLNTDHVDVMQLHGPTVVECRQGELLRALEDMRAQGKVRWLGVSTRLPHLTTYLDWGLFDVFQIPYSALEREHEGWTTLAAAAGIGTIIRGGVAKGAPGMGIGQEEVWQKFDEANLDELREAGESRTSFMLRFTLTHPGVNTIIVGTLNPAHLNENVGAVLKGPLSPDVYDEAKSRLDGVGQIPAKTP